MAKLPFIVTHDGYSACCSLVVSKSLQVRHIEVHLVDAASDRAMVIHRRICERIEGLNDLIAAEVPWEVFEACRRGPGMFASIIDPAATALEGLRDSLARNGNAV